MPGGHSYSMVLLDLKEGHLHAVEEQAVEFLCSPRRDRNALIPKTPENYLRKGSRNSLLPLPVQSNSA